MEIQEALRCIPPCSHAYIEVLEGRQANILCDLRVDGEGQHQPCHPFDCPSPRPEGINPQNLVWLEELICRRGN